MVIREQQRDPGSFQFIGNERFRFDGTQAEYSVDGTFQVFPEGQEENFSGTSTVTVGNNRRETIIIIETEGRHTQDQAADFRIEGNVTNLERCDLDVCVPADFNEDGVVDIEDVNAFFVGARVSF
jgi:hypothetical protein